MLRARGRRKGVTATPRAPALLHPLAGSPSSPFSLPGLSSVLRPNSFSLREGGRSSPARQRPVSQAQPDHGAAALCFARCPARPSVEQLCGLVACSAAAGVLWAPFPRRVPNCTFVSFLPSLLAVGSLLLSIKLEEKSAVCPRAEDGLGMHLVVTALLVSRRSAPCTRCELEILSLGVWGYI